MTQSFRPIPGNLTSGLVAIAPNIWGSFQLLVIQIIIRETIEARCFPVICYGIASMSAAQS